MRCVDLDEIVMATFFDDKNEEWNVKVCTIEDVLCSVCEEYAEYEAEPIKPWNRRITEDADSD